MRAWPFNSLLMAFTNELISGTDKDRFLSFNIRTAGNRQIEPYKWTIDRDRDAFVVPMGGGIDSQDPTIYALVWMGQQIRFHTITKAHGSNDTGIEVWWDVLRIEIPQKLEAKREEIMLMIREALDAHGWIFNRKVVKATHISFSPMTKIKEK